MKNNKTSNSKASRGYVSFSQEITLIASKDDLIEQFQSKKATERTYAAHHLRNWIQEERTIDLLLQQLVKEKALYTRIEICETLALGNITCVKKMIPYLTVIGNNQIKEIPDRPSLKKSYPLSRDLIARTLGHMDVSCLPAMMASYASCTLLQKRELIDAIGHLCFYHDEYKKEVHSFLSEAYKEDDHLLRYKIVVALSATMPLSKDILTTLVQEDNVYKKEAWRSLNMKKSS